MTRLLDLLTDPRTPLVFAAVAALARVVYALVSRLVQPYPRARAAVEAVAALAPDVVRAALQLAAAVTGRPPITLDLPPADPRVVAAAARALAAEARVAELTAGPGDGVRPTVVPGEPPARSPDEATTAARTGRHRIPPGTMGALCLALALGCGPARDALMSATPGVPPVSGCTTGNHRCNGAVPEVCSETGRWWPALPRDAQGAQRVCPAGCAVAADGAAYCAAADGGAR